MRLATIPGQFPDGELVVVSQDGARYLWSLWTLAPKEMKTGFGWVQAKPACSAAPFAVTPDELGDEWTDCRVQLNLKVEWNGELFGNAHGGDMSVGFHDLVAHAAATRDLWRNSSETDPCRIVFVLTEAAGPYLHDGEPLVELKP